MTPTRKTRMRFTEAELDALGEACGFALAGEGLDGDDSGAKNAALARAHAKLGTIREQSSREHAMLDLLRDALQEIDMELTSAGRDEIDENPILKAKEQFVDRARAQITRWEQAR